MGDQRRAQPAPGRPASVEGADGAEEAVAIGRTALDDRALHDAAAGGVAGASSPLPHLDAIQRSFGRHDVSHARAAVGGPAATATAAIGAEAYATGDRVAFGAAPSLHTAAHEAAHVVQQRAGVHLAGGIGGVADRHEQHADAVADLVVAGQSAEPLLDAYATTTQPTGTAAPAVQGKFLNVFGDPIPPLRISQLIEGFRQSADYRRLQRAHGLTVELLDEGLADLQLRDAFKVVIRTGEASANDHYAAIADALLTWQRSDPRRLLATATTGSTPAAIGASNIEIMHAINASRDVAAAARGVPARGVYYRDELPADVRATYWEGYADPAYFERLGPFTFRVRAGVSAAEALTRFLEGFTVAECNSAIQAALYGSILRTVGATRFDQRFGLAGGTTAVGARMRIEREMTNANPIDAFIAPTLDHEYSTPLNQPPVPRPSTPGARPVAPGAWYYIGNTPLYKHRHSDGMWGGLNAFHLDGTSQLFAGLGDNDRTEAQVYEDLAAAFNQPPTPAELVHVFESRAHETYPGIFLPTLGQAGSLAAVDFSAQALVALGARDATHARELLGGTLDADLVQPLDPASLGQSAGPPPPPIAITAPWTAVDATAISITPTAPIRFSDLVASYLTAFNLAIPIHRPKTAAKNLTRTRDNFDIPGDSFTVPVTRRIFFPHPTSYQPQMRSTNFDTGFRGTGKQLTGDAARV